MVVLAKHMGVGDDVLYSGAAVKLVEIYGEVGFPCWRKNEANVRSFFVNHPEIKVLPVDSHEEMLSHRNLIRSGWLGFSEPYVEESFDNWFYRQMCIPFSVRWTHCPLRKAAKSRKQIPVPDEPYIFIHQDRARGFLVNRINWSGKIIESDHQEGLLLDYVDVIENADEAHVFNSCYWAVAESLEPKGKLFCHWYARPQMNPVFDMHTTRHQWEILK